VKITNNEQCWDDIEDQEPGARIGNYECGQLLALEYIIYWNEVINVIQR